MQVTQQLFFECSNSKASALLIARLAAKLPRSHDLSELVDGEEEYQFYIAP